MEDSRKLVTIRMIDKISPIEGADRIVKATLGGWNCVISKDEFQEGDKVFYFETDSMLPLDSPVFEFLRPRGVKTKDGKEYHRLKAMKLRGVVSDGLLLPLSILNEFTDDIDKTMAEVEEDHAGDYSSVFRVIKYEDPILAKLGGKMTRWVDWISKTDEERIQNLKDLLDWIAKNDDWANWYATEKIDGTSVTIWGKMDVEGNITSGVCSRNYSIVYDPENTYWQIANTPCITVPLGDKLSPLEWIDYQLLEEHVVHPDFDVTVVLQGEIFGEGIQKNPLGIKGQQLRLFNLIINGEHKLQKVVESDYQELLPIWVPIHPVELPQSLEAIIAQPDGMKTLVDGANPSAQIEGLVWRNRNAWEIQPNLSKLDTIDWSKIPEDKHELVRKNLEKVITMSFKAISDKYRLKHQND